MTMYTKTMVRASKTHIKVGIKDDLTGSTVDSPTKLKVGTKKGKV